MPKVFLRTPYNYDADEISAETGLLCLDESLAEQDQAEDADINVIVRRFGLTGTMPQSVRVPTYGDFEGVFDFRSAMDAINGAERSFMELPASVRGRFQNDPALFVDFCSDPANVDELRRMGLTNPLPEVAPPPIPYS